MPKLPVTRLTLVAVGLLLCSLPLTGAELIRETVRAPVSGDAVADLRLVARGCPGFGPKHVLRGKAPKSPATCRPPGIDAGVIRWPLTRANDRDRHNYGRRMHGRRHTGTDFRARCGTPVHASHAGKVVLPRNRGGGPRSVGISTGPRRLTTWYGHLRKVRVRNGAVVRVGRTLGRVARAGRSACHLHFSVYLRAGARDPVRVNPSRWLRRHRATHVAGLGPAERRKGAFIAATLNVLGHSHTARGGKKRRQFASSAKRMRRSISLLRSNRVALVGLQEFQSVQRRQFLRHTKGWRVFSPHDPQDSIAWQASRFRLLGARAFRIPYFRGKRPMPVVHLRDRATGRRLVVISVHNPANKGHRRTMHKRRVAAVGRELRMVQKMRRRTHAPVILMGDFNDRSRKFYCRVVKHGLKASSGGLRARRCRPAQGVGIDWIFGTRKIRFQAHQRVTGGMVARTTDHPLVLTRIRR